MKDICMYNDLIDKQGSIISHNRKSMRSDVGQLTKSLTIFVKCFLRMKPFNRPHFVGPS